MKTRGKHEIDGTNQCRFHTEGKGPEDDSYLTRKQKLRFGNKVWETKKRRRKIGGGGGEKQKRGLL